MSVKKAILLLGVPFIAVIIAAASCGGLGQGCADAVELPESEKYIAMKVAHLLGSVSETIDAVKQPETNTHIDDRGYSYLPQQAVILEAELSTVNDVSYLEQNVRDTLYRVGDLAFLLIGNKKLIIRVVDSHGFTTPGYFMLDKNALEDFSRCQYEANTFEETMAYVNLGFFASSLRQALPGSGNNFRFYYFPGFGGHVMLRFDSVATDWSCEDWRTHLKSSMDRVPQNPFDAFKEGETLTLEVYIWVERLLEGVTGYFVINKDTADNPSEWEVYYW